MKIIDNPKFERKILFFIHHLQPRGAERQCVELLAYLKKNTNCNLLLVLTKDIVNYSKFFELQIPYIVIQRKYWKKDPSLFFKFYKIAKAFKPDIIHTWSPMVSFYSIPTKVLLRIPMLNYQIQTAPEKKIQKIDNYKINYFFSDLIVANSIAGLNAFKTPPKKSKVVYNGFVFDRIQNIAEPKIIKEKLNIDTKYCVGMVAAFHETKDYKTFVEAAIKLLRIRNDITILGIGSGDKSKYNHIIPVELKKSIRLLDWQENVEEIMNICDIGVLSTFSEGISNSLMEFMALKKAVIATLGGGTSELVVNNETGILVNPSSPIMLFEKISYLLNNDDLRTEMGLKAKKRIEETFSMEKMGKSFIELYRNISKIK
ncbi:MAG: hypothetical protein A2499_03200 [Stygiobacter sp. RIFOXYC12_FULL_38_8]|nr:MAG: hypothetical protein A2279_06195 [Stygiobacter sp. RIFOXYA12_FULL_38_9]OGV15001.1 MAG: hypothetical protein A2440_06535 [Stygiobacter sp. RIFOXYC2_FULL_38_25]OGV17903.1 MAG: hypothetical protein A2237_03230 [Stygiobacter sp. RIFOXYA2_FULL_38_8]OGV22117.1 MAG: hypothetical protein A2499_03200 [Stygiobacter sp. RIFOXYC12_FULL_38_8]OGV79575.1 MAG: hypothetical protein A2X65_18615 [Stygiobacter sp. GWF2_38_21]